MIIITMFKNRIILKGVNFLFVLLTISFHKTVAGQTQITADFSLHADPPLIKTKFNVYQTPLAPMSRLERDMPLLKELQIRSLRFETAWGKSVDFNAPSITGTFPEFKYNRTGYTRFIKGVMAQNVYPLLTVGYNPDPLKPGKDSRDKPNDMKAWQNIAKDFALYWKQLGVKPIDYEIWNEPDLNIFFNGTKADYFDIYKAGATGIKEGDPDAKVGGPVAAFSGWYKDFLSFVKSNNLPLDFLSGHAYANAPRQLDSMRSALGKYNWPRVEMYMTEYASYTSSPNTDIAEGGAQERYVAAADFLTDARMFLNYTDLTKVYWAQWLDVELLSKEGKWYYNKGTDKMGLVDLSGKRKALFNGFKIYNMMPVDRNDVTLSSKAADAMASSDSNNAALVIWNPSNYDTTVSVSLNHIPFSKGKIEVFRIDSKHSSYYENGKDELEMTEAIPLTANAFNWSGVLPAKGVVFFKISDGSTISELRSNAAAQDIRTYHWFSDRGNSNYADFDRLTWIARLGMGSQKDTGISQIGVEMTNIPARLRITAETFGKPHVINNNSLLGYRFDFMDNSGKYIKSILYHGRIYNVKRNVRLPWAKGGQADTFRLINIKNARINVAKLVPPHFSGKMVLSFLLQNTGRNSAVKFSVFKNSTKTIVYKPKRN